MKVVTVVGARPQFIKASSVSQALSTAGVNERLIDTGQHYDDEMAGAFFRELALPKPAYSLNVGSDTHARMTARMLEGVEAALVKESPNMVLVYGDTNSTLAGALSAAKLGIPVAHVEAGLRSFRATMPEEINRRLTDHCSAILFCPTETAVRQLKREGVARPDTTETLEYLAHCKTCDLSARPFVINIGDVMVDTLLAVRRRCETQPPAVSLPVGDYALLTLHRAESTDDPNVLSHIIREVSDLADALPVVFPVHPRTRVSLEKNGIWQAVSAHPGILCLPPLSYGAFTWAQSRSKVIVTDSGGIQKEAAILGVPCITLRDETEWVETVESGWNHLVGTRPKRLQQVVVAAERPALDSLTCYGDGQASERIATVLARQ